MANEEIFTDKETQKKIEIIQKKILELHELIQGMHLSEERSDLQKETQKFDRYLTEKFGLRNTKG